MDGCGRWSSSNMYRTIHVRIEIRGELVGAIAIVDGLILLGSSAVAGTPS
jgi:hypothetical protein